MWQSFGAVVRSDTGRRFAVRAKAEVRFDTFTETDLRGVLRLSNIRCIRKPPGAACPKYVETVFWDHVDGARCPSTMRRGRPGEQYPVLRYFTLYPDEEGRWSLGTAYQTYWD
jgi:hypothetical protein